MEQRVLLDQHKTESTLDQHNRVPLVHFFATLQLLFMLSLFPYHHLNLTPSLSFCLLWTSSSSFLFFASSAFFSTSSTLFSASLVAFLFSSSSALSHSSASQDNLCASSFLFFATSSSCFLSCSVAFPFLPTVVIFCLNLLLKDVMF